ncbi:MAG TPA: trehalose-phosphatase [Pelagibacterium sp.]|uniref:trehalose-phosphatase n=1 Tax=Pelagibacterium sp. TaxID=1967288 RepID=UPI002CA08311|nr:trehalose-phosphatase [Pelagibacterium sp.]HWJ88582.1 trehalose-phosphatase [Pelagibacterium sp.]
MERPAAQCIWAAGLSRPACGMGWDFSGTPWAVTALSLRTLLQHQPAVTMPDTVSAILSATPDAVAIFTDFDGTLVEIAPRPDAIVVPPELASRLEALHAALGGALAIVTGRTIAAIDAFLFVPDISVTGSHGAEWRHEHHVERPLGHLLADAAEIAHRVSDTLNGQPDLLVEPKPTGVAVHYRAAPEKGALAHAALVRAIDGFNDFQTVDGKKVIEARPKSADKGSAIARLMQVKPFAGRIPIFIGDDVTDEDGFAAADRLGGFGIRIGEGETHARYVLPDIAALYTYFDALITARHPAATPHPNRERSTP